MRRTVKTIATTISATTRTHPTVTPTTRPTLASTASDAAGTKPGAGVVWVGTLVEVPAGSNGESVKFAGDFVDTAMLAVAGLVAVIAGVVSTVGNREDVGALVLGNVD